MQILAAYAAVVLIWGSTFAAIPYQLGVVAIELSVAYRFAIAALALLLYALLTKRSLRIPVRLLPYVLVQGVLLYSLNYFLVYNASAFVTTGLIAVLFTMIIPTNALFENRFFGTRFDRRFFFAAGLGITGIALVFWPEISRLSLADSAVIGILLALGSVLSASLGNMMAAYTMRLDVPVIALNVAAMAAAAVFSTCVALAQGHELAFSTQPAYLLSLLHLSVLGSAVAFGCYLSLIREIGPSRAAYISVLFPVVALGLSTVFEAYVWTMTAAVGILLTLLGNWLILRIRQ